MKHAIQIRLFNSSRGFLRGNFATRLVVAHDSAPLVQKLLPPPSNSSSCPASRTLRREIHWPHMLITDYNNRKAECLSMKLCLFEQFDIYSEGLLRSVHGNLMPVSCLRVLLHCSFSDILIHVTDLTNYETSNIEWPMLLVSGLGKIKNWHPVNLFMLF